MKDRFKCWFLRFAKLASKGAGNPLAFMLAATAIVIWIVTGPMFGYSDTWQLIINTGTTIITFLMVFLIQNTQNRDSMAVQVKLDEIIRSSKGAHVALLDLEELSEDELEAFRKKYRQLAEDARQRLRNGDDDTDSPRLEIGDSEPESESV